MDNEMQEPPGGCPLCLRARLSVEHIMLDCPQLATKRRRHLIVFTHMRDPTMKHILDKEIKVKAVMIYLKAIGAYDAV